MNTIGVLGGLGPQATMDFEQQVHFVSQRLIPRYENQGYPRMIVYYLRHAPMKVGVDNKPSMPLEPDLELLDAAAYLGQMSDFIVMVSSTPHFFITDIEKVSGKRVLSMITVTIDEIRRRGNKKAGIISIGSVLKNNLYQDALHAYDIAHEVIPQEMAEELDKSIFAVMEGRVDEKLSQTAEKAVKYLEDKGVDSIILGCTELPFLVDVGKNRLLINPTHLLATAAVEQAIK